MANEVTVPLLPCPSIDDIVTIYGVLGFRTTYKQRKPNACAGVQREDVHLQFFEIARFDRSSPMAPVSYSPRTSRDYIGQGFSVIDPSGN